MNVLGKKESHHVRVLVSPVTVADGVATKMNVGLSKGVIHEDENT